MTKPIHNNQSKKPQTSTKFPKKQYPLEKKKSKPNDNSRLNHKDSQPKKSLKADKLNTTPKTKPITDKKLPQYRR